jgi:surface carbohydrate biosynthesis protein
MPKICLIVDNPLRDLDGLVLVAWQLAQHGAECWLVPMYEQAFDVFAIGADFVLENYIRPNNVGAIRSYRKAGIGVGVLDTEGTGGKSADEFAVLVGTTGATGELDLYCVWGSGQFKAIRALGLVDEERLRLTGCPRYDYCAQPWRRTLASPQVDGRFVLVNTNFPVVNPRFSLGQDAERNAMLQAGFSADFASKYIQDAKRAHAGMIGLMEELLQRFPQWRFILRPHPFESKDAYASLERHPNFEVRQTGTSVEWLNACDLLVHLNCSTALEAAMLGKKSISPRWLDTPTLHVPPASAVSECADSLDELVAAVCRSLSKTSGSDATRQVNSICETHHVIDGHAAERVAQAILGSLSRRHGARPAPAPRVRLLQLLRGVLGRRLYGTLQGLIVSRSLAESRKAKSLDVTHIRGLLNRIADVAGPGFAPVEVRLMAESTLVRPRMASGRSVRISALS